jgi:hypothetical protein
MNAGNYGKEVLIECNSIDLRVKYVKELENFKKKSYISRKKI